MSFEETVGCMQDIDIMLMEIESAIYSHNHDHAMRKIKTARSMIAEFHTDLYDLEAQDVGTRLLNRLK